MSDELDDLKAAFAAATPEADPLRRQENLRHAEENFAAAQGSDDERRLPSKRSSMGRIGQGVRQMFDALTTRAGMTATTALVAIGFVAILPNSPFQDATQNFAPKTEVSASDLELRKESLTQVRG